MAGVGRRTPYRKHLTDLVLHDFPEPEADEHIAKVVATRGSNQFDVILPKENDETSDCHTPELAILPTKFHKLVWVKRNNFLIVKGGSNVVSAAPDTAGDTAKNKVGNNNGIKYMIEHILYKDQIKHLCAKGLWPSQDSEFATEFIQEPDVSDNNDKNGDDHDDGIVYEDAYSDEDDAYFVNTNQTKRLTTQESSDSDSERSGN